MIVAISGSYSGKVRDLSVTGQGAIRVGYNRSFGVNNLNESSRYCSCDFYRPSLLLADTPRCLVREKIVWRDLSDIVRIVYVDEQASMITSSISC